MGHAETSTSAALIDRIDDWVRSAVWRSAPGWPGAPDCEWGPGCRRTRRAVSRRVARGHPSRRVP